MRQVESVDIVYGASCGDEAKGKVVSHLSSFKHKTSGMLRTEKKHYDIVARVAGGQNAGHTIYHNGNKYKTHIVPAGIFNGIISMIGPGCVFNLDLLKEEIRYLEQNGFDSDLIRISPNAHIVTNEHIEFDKANLAAKLGTTSKGIAPAYAAKYARTGIQFKDVAQQHTYWERFLFDGNLYGNILCEGAQGFYLDINWGYYPFITSSETLPYAACSLGFSPKKIRNIYAVAKIYDTRSGQDDKNFPESLFDNPELLAICDAGKEFGTTTGRRRKVNYLNLDRLIFALNTGGGNKLIISKCDVLDEVKIYKLFYNGELITFDDKDLCFGYGAAKSMQNFIELKLNEKCPEVEEVFFSYSPETVEGLTID